MNLDHELRRAFTRKPAPPGFADRVLAQIEQLDTAAAGRSTVVRAAGGSAASRHRAIRWLAAAAAAIVVTASGGRYYSHYRTEAEAARVQQEVRLALQLTGEKLALVQRILQEAHKSTQ
jgi:hypothetical protein